MWRSKEKILLLIYIFLIFHIFYRNGSVIATLGLIFTKDAPGNLDPLTKALLAGKIGDMPVASKYESAGKNKLPC